MKETELSLSQSNMILTQPHYFDRSSFIRFLLLPHAVTKLVTITIQLLLSPRYMTFSKRFCFSCPPLNFSVMSRVFSPRKLYLKTPLSTFLSLRSQTPFNDVHCISPQHRHIFMLYEHYLYARSPSISQNQLLFFLVKGQKHM